MRKIIVSEHVTIDGYLAGPNGEMDWMTWDWDEELKNYVSELTKPVDCIIMGRKLMDGFIGTWKSRLENPETADDFARKMIETPKVVFSKTIENVEWENTTVAKNNLAEEISQLKNQSGQDIIVYGGSNFVSSLIKENLIDEYNFFINPVVLGKGMTIFSDLENRLNLTLVKSQMFSCGIALLCYESPK